MSKVTIDIDRDDFDRSRIDVDPETGEITVWHDRNGRRHSFEKLAPYTETDQ